MGPPPPALQLLPPLPIFSEPLCPDPPLGPLSARHPLLTEQPLHMGPNPSVSPGENKLCISLSEASFCR